LFRCLLITDFFGFVFGPRVAPHHFPVCAHATYTHTAWFPPLHRVSLHHNTRLHFLVAHILYGYAPRSRLLRSSVGSGSFCAFVRFCAAVRTRCVLHHLTLYNTTAVSAIRTRLPLGYVRGCALRLLRVAVRFAYGSVITYTPFGLQFSSHAVMLRWIRRRPLRTARLRYRLLLRTCWFRTPFPRFWTTRAPVSRFTHYTFCVRTTRFAFVAQFSFHGYAHSRSWVHTTHVRFTRFAVFFRRCTACCRSLSLFPHFTVHVPFTAYTLHGSLPGCTFAGSGHTRLHLLRFSFTPLLPLAVRSVLRPHLPTRSPLRFTRLHTFRVHFLYGFPLGSYTLLRFLRFIKFRYTHGYVHFDAVHGLPV